MSYQSKHSLTPNSDDMLSRYDSVLSGLFDLIVIVEQLRWMSNSLDVRSGAYGGCDSYSYPTSFTKASHHTVAKSTRFNDDSKIKQTESYLESMQQEF